MKDQRRFAYASIAVASFTTLVFELTQTRILSYIFWNHIVYVTVALALLGFGISGTLVSLMGNSNQQFHSRNMSRLWFGFGTSMLLGIAFTAWILPVFAGASELFKLGLCYIVFVVPFIFSGAILAINLAQASKTVGKLYAVDLLFAGLACLLFFWLLPAMGAVLLVLAMASTAFVFGYLASEKTDRLSRSFSFLGVILVAYISVNVSNNPRFLDFQTERYKEMGRMMEEHPDSKIERTTWTPLARIDVVGNDNANLWDYHEHPRGSYKIVTQDGSAHTRLLSKRALDKLRSEVEAKNDSHLFNMVYDVKESPEVAVIGVGGGIDVAYALAYGATSVTGIELNPAIFRYARDEFADYNGHLLSDPRVTLMNREGRSALRSLEKQFDVVQINAIDTFAALSSGAYVLSESNLYTVEAFEDILDRLNDQGILSMHRWVFLPPRESLRVSVLACEAFKRKGIEHSDQRIMVVRRGKWAVTLIKKSPFTVAEVETVKERAENSDCEILYWPKVFEPSRQSEIENEYFATVSEETSEGAASYNTCIAAYQNGTENEFFASYLYNVTPTTADSPFFFEYNFRNSVGLPKTTSLLRDTLRMDASSSIYLILVQSTLFIVLAIFLPLWKFHRQAAKFRGSMAWSTYFAAIGLSFMIVEIAVIQKCVLFLGNPMYSLSVVLASILVSAGLGSAWFGTSGWTFETVIRRLSGVLIGSLLFTAVAMTPFFTSLLHLPLAARVLLVVAATFPLGFQMGIFFPAGLQMVRNQKPQYVPWAWGINGCASVYGSIVAILIAIVYGFNASLLIGTTAYAVGFVTVYLGVLRRKSDEVESSGEEVETEAVASEQSPEESSEVRELEHV